MNFLTFLISSNVIDFNKLIEQNIVSRQLIHRARTRPGNQTSMLIVIRIYKALQVAERVKFLGVLIKYLEDFGNSKSETSIGTGLTA